MTTTDYDGSDLLKFLKSQSDDPATRATEDIPRHAGKGTARWSYRSGRHRAAASVDAR
jgi:hypothetical protein